MSHRWRAAGGYWYPPNGDSAPDAVAFDAYAFEKHVAAHVFQSILGEYGLQTAFELREYGPEYELELNLLIPGYNGAEGYWTADDMDWLVYASHASTITVAGDWLAHSIQQSWPTWSEYLIVW